MPSQTETYLCETTHGCPGRLHKLFETWMCDTCYAEIGKEPCVAASVGPRSRELVTRLLLALGEVVDGPPWEDESHVMADALLLELLDDEAITDAFEKIRKWYA